MKLPGEMPRSLVNAPAVMALGAAIYSSFSLDYSGWSWIPIMWLAHLGLFLGLLGGAFVLVDFCARLGLSDTATTHLCLATQIVSFLAAIRIPLTL